MNRLDSDGDIISRVLRGSRDDFGSLVTRYQGLIFTVIKKLVKDGRIAEELMQEAFIKAYRKLDSLKERNRFKAWLVQIATNESFRWLRKKNPNVMSVRFFRRKGLQFFFVTKQKSCPYWVWKTLPKSTTNSNVLVRHSTSCLSLTAHQ